MIYYLKLTQLRLHKNWGIDKNDHKSIIKMFLETWPSN
jgi:hypothetical protein